jgi:hypothetical protein
MSAAARAARALWPSWEANANPIPKANFLASISRPYLAPLRDTSSSSKVGEDSHSKTFRRPAQNTWRLAVGCPLAETKPAGAEATKLGPSDRGLPAGQPGRPPGTTLTPPLLLLLLRALAASLLLLRHPCRLRPPPRALPPPLRSSSSSSAPLPPRSYPQRPCRLAPSPAPSRHRFTPSPSRSRPECCSARLSSSAPRRSPPRRA